VTTTVKVFAHCASTKEVHISLNGAPHAAIQDEQSWEGVVYDDRELSVKEVVKPTQEPVNG
jgi:hypothetical protein